MAKIAVVGAGQAGLLTAHALHQTGHQVTLYSDKSPEDFLTKARPTGTAARFDMSLTWERELGLEHWGDVAPRIEGVHLTFCPEKNNQLLTLLGRVSRHCLAVDVRLQSATWMRELAAKGARVEIETVTVERLDEISAQNDLTIVAAGRAELVKLFPRDAQRSTYATPQRLLTMVNVTGIPMRLPYAPWYCPVKFNLFGPYGEAFWVPWYSKGGQQAWSLLFEAKPGSPLDRFRDVKTGEQALARAKEVIREMTPWDADWVSGAELCDENAWLVGSFLPEVRQVVGTLPSGRSVIAVGDTAQSLDPIGGQGANNGNKMARNLVACIAERSQGPFDAAWMRSTFERFWQQHQLTERFNNTLLEPLTGPGKMLLMAQYGSMASETRTDPQQKLANLVCENFNDPRLLTEAFHDAAKPRQVLRDLFGSAVTPLLRGALKVAQGQLRQKLGLPARHPGMPA